MGDSGALLIGLLCSVLAIKFIDCNANLSKDLWFQVESAPIVSIGLLILPLFDTLRVICVRIYRGEPPYQGDRRHIHHMLIDVGLSHSQATGLLLLVNGLFLGLVFFLNDRVDGEALLLIILFTALFLTYILTRVYFSRRHLQNSLT